MDEADLAHWQHAALVWMALWHAADMPSITAAQVHECLEAALLPAIEHEAKPKLISGAAQL